MGKLIDLTGQKFGRLTVIGRSDRRDLKRVYWDCICDCGNSHLAEGWNLRNGIVQSCGCLFTESITIHGGHKDRLYKVLCAMKDRCNNPNNHHFKYYGGKGIHVCPEWDDYRNFKKWAMENGYAEGLTIDRINSNGDYCPENCRWITRSKNSSRTARRLLTVNGITKNYRQWEECIGMGKMSIEHWVERHGEEYAIKRIDATLHPEKYSQQEINDLGIYKNKRKYVSINGETKSYSAWAKIIGRPHMVVLGWAKKYGDEYAIQKIMEYLDAGRE